MKLRTVQFQGYIYLLLIALSFFYKTVQSQLVACVPEGEQTQGFIARFFPYTINDQKAITSLDYVNGGYLQDSPIGEVDGIIEPYFNFRPCVLSNTQHTCDPPNSYSLGKRGYYYCGKTKCKNPKTSVVSGISVYGFPITATNFTVELTGYLYINVSGLYTFSIDSVDDAAGISIGAGVAFDCCDQNTTNVSANASLSVNGMKPWTASSPPISDTIYLFAGHYYPVKVVYVNMMNQGMMSTSVTGPDGYQINDWGSMVYSFDSSQTRSEGSCIDEELPEVPQFNTSSTDIGTNGTTSTEYNNDETGGVILPTNTSYIPSSSLTANSYSTLLVNMTSTMFVTLTITEVETSVVKNSTTYYITSTILSTLTIPETITNTRFTNSTMLTTSTVPETVTSTELTNLTVLSTLTVPETVTNTEITNSTILSTLTIPQTATETRFTNSTVLQTSTEYQTTTHTEIITRNETSIVQQTSTVRETVTSILNSTSVHISTSIIPSTTSVTTIIPQTSTKFQTSVIIQNITSFYTVTDNFTSTAIETSISIETNTVTKTTVEIEISTEVLTSTATEISMVTETLTQIEYSTTVETSTLLQSVTTIETLTVAETLTNTETHIMTATSVLVKTSNTVNTSVTILTSVDYYTTTAEETSTITLNLTTLETVTDMITSVALETSTTVVTSTVMETSLILNTSTSLIEATNEHTTTISATDTITILTTFFETFTNTTTRTILGTSMALVTVSKEETSTIYETFNISQPVTVPTYTTILKTNIINQTSSVLETSTVLEKVTETYSDTIQVTVTEHETGTSFMVLTTYTMIQTTFISDNCINVSTNLGDETFSHPQVSQYNSSSVSSSTITNSNLGTDFGSSSKTDDLTVSNPLYSSISSTIQSTDSNNTTLNTNTYPSLPLPSPSNSLSNSTSAIQLSSTITNNNSEIISGISSNTIVSSVTDSDAPSTTRSTTNTRETDQTSYSLIMPDTTEIENGSSSNLINNSNSGTVNEQSSNTISTEGTLSGTTLSSTNHVTSYSSSEINSFSYSVTFETSGTLSTETVNSLSNANVGHISSSLTNGNSENNHPSEISKPTSSQSPEISNANDSAESNNGSDFYSKTGTIDETDLTSNLVQTGSSDQHSTVTGIKDISSSLAAGAFERSSVSTDRFSTQSSTSINSSSGYEMQNNSPEIDKTLTLQQSQNTNTLDSVTNPYLRTRKAQNVIRDTSENNQILNSNSGLLDNEGISTQNSQLMITTSGTTTVDNPIDSDSGYSNSIAGNLPFTNIMKTTAMETKTTVDSRSGGSEVILGEGNILQTSHLIKYALLVGQLII